MPRCDIYCVFEYRKWDRLSKAAGACGLHRAKLSNFLGRVKV